MTPNDIATDISGLPQGSESGNINMPSFNHTYTMGRHDDTNQWDY